MAVPVAKPDVAAIATNTVVNFMMMTQGEKEGLFGRWLVNRLLMVCGVGGWGS